MKKSLLFFVAALIFIVHSAFADPVADVTGLLNHIKTMQANFTQIIYDNHKKAVQKNTGSMALARPGQFRWDVTQPIPQLIIANGGKLWIYDPDLQQVTIRALGKAASGMPGLLLSQTTNSLNTSFAVTPMTTKQANWRWFALKPKQADVAFSSIELGFEGNQIARMELIDNLGHTTDIQFSAIKTNTPLSANLFVFKVGKGIDVIDETKSPSRSN